MKFIQNTKKKINIEMHRINEQPFKGQWMIVLHNTQSDARVAYSRHTIKIDPSIFFQEFVKSNSQKLQSYKVNVPFQCQCGKNLNKLDFSGLIIDAQQKKVWYVDKNTFQPQLVTPSQNKLYQLFAEQRLWIEIQRKSKLQKITHCPQSHRMAIKIFTQSGLFK